MRSIEAFLFNWGDVSGIEVRSIMSRCKAPWIEVHSTEAFNLIWVRIEVRSTEAFNLRGGTVVLFEQNDFFW